MIFRSFRSRPTVADQQKTRPSRSRRQSPQGNLRRWWRYFYLRLTRLQATPKQIARGLAIGVFWGMFPLPGLQMLVAVVTAALLQSNKLAAAAGTWLSNPLTTVPFVVMHFQVGLFLRSQSLAEIPLRQAQSLAGFLHLGSDLIASFLLGCFVNGLVAGVMSYLLAVPIVSWIQHRMHRNAKAIARSTSQLH